jgi:hypothetical protein
VFPDHLGKLVTQQRLGTRPSAATEGVGPIAEFQQLPMLLAMAFAKLAAGPCHECSLAVEVGSHQLLQACNEKRELDLFAACGLTPTVGKCEVIDVDRVVAEQVLVPDQGTYGVRLVIETLPRGTNQTNDMPCLAAF